MKVKGSLPEGLTSPKSRSAMALPASSPGYQASSSAGTRSIQRVRSTGSPLLRMTTVLGFAAATAWMSSSWPVGREITPMKRKGVYQGLKPASCHAAWRHD
jgi:hypothetical protein